MWAVILYNTTVKSDLWNKPRTNTQVVSMSRTNPTPLGIYTWTALPGDHEDPTEWERTNPQPIIIGKGNCVDFSPAEPGTGFYVRFNGTGKSWHRLANSKPINFLEITGGANKIEFMSDTGEPVKIRVEIMRCEP
jgi:hypothetical protein